MARYVGDDAGNLAEIGLILRQPAASAANAIIMAKCIPSWFETSNLPFCLAHMGFRGPRAPWSRLTSCHHRPALETEPCWTEGCRLWRIATAAAEAAVQWAQAAAWADGVVVASGVDGGVMRGRCGGRLRGGRGRMCRAGSCRGRARQERCRCSSAQARQCKGLAHTLRSRGRACEPRCMPGEAAAGKPTRMLWRPATGPRRKPGRPSAGE
jgi:hypothetical protein